MADYTPTDADFVDNGPTDADFIANISNANKRKMLANPLANYNFTASATEGRNRVAQDIPNRFSFIKDLKDNPITPQTLMQHPFLTAGRGIMGTLEGAQGTAADIALGLQNGKEGIQQIPHDIASTWAGDRPTNYADVAESSGLPGISNPTAAQAIGLLASIGRGNLAGNTALSKVGNFLTNTVSGLPNLPGQAISSSLKAIRNIPGISKAATGITDAVKTRLGGAIESTSQVPSDFAVRAMNDPRILDDKWLANQKAAIAPEYDAHIKVLDSSPHATLTLPNAAHAMEERPTQTLMGTPSSEMGNLSTAQQDTIKYYDELIKNAQTKPTSFNAVKTAVNNISRDLKTYYASINKGGSPRVSKYESWLINTRNGLMKDISQTFPGFADVNNKMASVLNAEDVNRAFSSGRGSFFRGLPLRVAMGTLGTALGPIPGAAGLYSLGSFYATQPAGQAEVIKNLSRARAMTNLPSLGLSAIRSLQGNTEPNDQTGY